VVEDPSLSSHSAELRFHPFSVLGAMDLEFSSHFLPEETVTNSRNHGIQIFSPTYL
jgi:hypothetical protein